MTDSARHTVTEDAQGFALGVFLCALGLQFLTHAGLITGQTAGIAVILSYLTGWSFGVVFFVINLPFYLLAWARLGPQFTVKSLISVTALSALTLILPDQLAFANLSTPMAALTFGALTGVGLLVIFRHNGSLGGLGVVALMVQDKTGFRAGYVQLCADAIIFGVALFLFPLTVVLWSLAGAVVLNLIIAINHRRDRYIAT
ncbi:YitT family protein [Pseudotabrizicola algicola]|uniref:YitT family protein n=1 Tax=Pseudotabrizicola algicola TaxID=2709381 RepID=A0A6B3RIG8_9RHOB|nr:YitT family protein [Pseudotabrizicola algicola]NEX44986.1 YitT family protein [Pseudotabrizicola algicola]